MDVDDRGLANGLFGFIRAAKAVDLVLAQIRAELEAGFLPQRNQLLETLNLGSSVASQVEEYALLSAGHTENARTIYAAGALKLVQLEDALVDLRRAVTWASRFSGFNWWLRHRQTELVLDHFVIVPGPGSSRDFFIERESSIAKCFADAQNYLELSEDRLAQIGRIRILTVPQSDGAAVKWNPISLGHELGHLRFDNHWVVKWLASLEGVGFPANYAVARAKKSLDLTSDNEPTSDVWYEQLRAWLIESACDATMYRYYGEGGQRALRAFLSAGSAATDTDDADHPSAAVRVAVLGATSADDLSSHREPEDAPTTRLNRKNSFCQLAVQCREAVWDELGSQCVDGALRDRVWTCADTSHEEASPPHASDWQRQNVLASPSSIESGLVSSLWGERDLPVDSTGAWEPLDWKVIDLRERHVEHAVNFLQFYHRFERVRSDYGVAGPELDQELHNVLHVSSAGIVARNGSQGLPSHDVRLGRHFIVFKRNQIATLNALDSEKKSRQLQEEVEIGWEDTFVLHPHEMVLAVTLEFLIMSKECTAQVLSRSSLGRMGLLSATAVQVQPGFRGCLTLELVNLASVPLDLHPGQRIAQIVPAAICGVGQYDGKYQNQDWKPQFTGVSQDWEMSVLRGLGANRT